MQVRTFWKKLAGLKGTFKLKGPGIRQRRTEACPICAVANETIGGDTWNIAAFTANKAALNLPDSFVLDIIEAADLKTPRVVKRAKYRQKMLSLLGLKERK